MSTPTFGTPAFVLEPIYGFFFILESCPIDENYGKEESGTINLDDDSSDDNIQFSEDEIELVTEDLQIVGVSKYKH